MKKYTAANFLTILTALLFLILSIETFPQQRAKHKLPQPKKFHSSNFKYYDNDSYSAEKAGVDEKHNFIENDKAAEKYSSNYFRFDRSGKSLWNGKHWKVEDFPLKIYVNKPASKYYKPEYKIFVNYALELWSLADERIKFQYVSSSSEAAMIINFEENLMNKYDENYLGLTDYEMDQHKKINRSKVEISLLKYDNKFLSDGEIKATIIHEIGHALGLGHSENDADIMYPFINPYSSDELDYSDLSAGDIEAIRSVNNLGNKMKYLIK